MKIAYIISAYKYPEQLTRLIRRLNASATSFCVHIDKRADDSIYHNVVDQLGDLPNIYFLKRHPCRWGDFGHVEATIKGIETLCVKGIPFDYAILLTGQDYPIKSNDFIREFLSANKTRSFLCYFPLPSDAWQNGGMDRIESWHFRVFKRHFVFPSQRSFPIKRKFPSGFVPFGGSSYWCLTRQCVEYIYEFLQSHWQFVNFFRRVDVPDEIFFQTILMNSPLRSSIVNDDLRYIDWKDANSGSPGILCAGDFEKISRSSKLFARKFDITVDADVLDMIDERLLRPIRLRSPEMSSVRHDLAN